MPFCQVGYQGPEKLGDQSKATQRVGGRTTKRLSNSRSSFMPSAYQEIGWPRKDTASGARSPGDAQLVQGHKGGLSPEQGNLVQSGRSQRSSSSRPS